MADHAAHPDHADRIDAFRAYRERMNARIFEIDHLGIKRFFSLDSAAYRDGALDGKTKELLGLVASTVLRCNDCIDYHIDQCIQAGWTDEELYDALNVALIVGGSIVIPHLRHAVESIDLIRAKQG
ncbi:MAG: carboxymuconolactone decarboxylase family protein [Thermomicrobiaceae bacterium]|nr:carboxymuconolactone decarboxylase family protein [Thermomicrobiaceae bacterium]